MNDDATSANDNRPALVIWGAGGHARVVADAVRAGGAYTVAAFLDDHFDSAQATEFCGAPLLPADALSEFQDRATHGIVAIGDCVARARAVERLVDAGFELTTIVHPAAAIAADVSIGPGTFIAAGAVVGPNTRLGASVIVNTRASVDHDCVIGDAAHVCPGVTLGGGVTVGLAAWIGIGSTVIQGVSIGERAFVAAGAVVVEDVPAFTLVRGVPARSVRSIE